MKRPGNQMEGDIQISGAGSRWEDVYVAVRGRKFLLNQEEMRQMAGKFQEIIQWVDRRSLEKADQDEKAQLNAHIESLRASEKKKLHAAVDLVKAQMAAKLDKTQAALSKAYAAMFYAEKLQSASRTVLARFRTIAPEWAALRARVDDFDDAVCEYYEAIGGKDG